MKLFSFSSPPTVHHERFFSLLPSEIREFYILLVLRKNNSYYSCGRMNIVEDYIYKNFVKKYTMRYVK